MREKIPLRLISVSYTHLDVYKRQSMVIPELIRLLGEEEIGFEEAVKIVTEVCAYTNHTILAEALEKWPESYLEEVVPQLMPVIRNLDQLAKKRTADENMAIIDGNHPVSYTHLVGEGRNFDPKGMCFLRFWMRSGNGGLW